MGNPWLEIPLGDLEGHMSLPEIAQAQMIADHFESLLRGYSPVSVAVIGCAGGNGLERIAPGVTTRIVGVDINPAYIEETRYRFAGRLPGLELCCGDIQTAEFAFAPVDLVYAALVLEYVDPSVALPKLCGLLKPGGLLSVLLQLPCPTMDEITPSPLAASLKSLAPIMRLKAPDEIQALAEACGLTRVASLRIDLPSGKQFQTLLYRRPGGDTRTHHDLDHLINTGRAEKAEAFEAGVKPLRRIDQELWKKDG